MTAGTTEAATPSRILRLRNGIGRASPFAIASVVLAMVFAVLAIYPILLVLWRLFFEDGTLNTELLRAIINEPDLPVLLRNTVVLVLSGGSIAVIAGAVLAWLVVRTDARIRWISNALPLLPFLLPSIVGVIGWTILLSPGAGFINVFIRGALGAVGIEVGDTGPFDIHSWYGMIGIYALYMTPFTFLLVSAGLTNMDSQLEEQARVSGASLFRTLRTVTIPAVSANLGAALLLTVWFGFAFFSGPAILSPRSGIDVLSVRIVNRLTFSYPPQTGVAIGLSGFMLVAVGVAWYLQTRVLRKSRFAVVGGRDKATTIELGRWKWAGRALILGYVASATILPVAALLWLALRGYWSSKLSFDGLSLEQFRVVTYRDALTRESIFTSLRLAFVGATIGMIAAAIIARFVRTSQSRMGSGIDALVKVSAPIPSIVLGVGFVLAFGGPPFNLNGTYLILLLAYLAHFLPQATVSADAAAAQVGPQLGEASHISGAGDARTFSRINLPLMLPGLVAGWALLFLWMLGELNASVILASTTSPVIGFQIYNFYIQGFYGRLAALSILLLAIDAIVVTLIMLLGRRRLRLGRLSMRGGAGV